MTTNEKTKPIQKYLQVMSTKKTNQKKKPDMMKLAMNSRSLSVTQQVESVQPV